MTTTIQVKRICEYCSKEFMSKTTVTRFCSVKCRSRSYKAGVRGKKIQTSNEELMRYKSLQRELIKSKEFLKVKEVAILLDCSVRTVYYYIDLNVIEATNIGQRMTRVRRSSLDKLLDRTIAKQEFEIKESQPREYTLEECISTQEVRKKYGISDSALYNLIIRNKIPKIRHGIYAYVPRELIERFFNPTT